MKTQSEKKHMSQFLKYLIHDITIVFSTNVSEVIKCPHEAHWALPFTSPRLIQNYRPKYPRIKAGTF